MVIAAAALLGLATYAVAAREAGSVATYTGCLKNGKHEFTDPGAVVLRCKNEFLQGSARWFFLKFTAIQVARVSNAPLAVP
jgi:hypothetical protein